MCSIAGLVSNAGGDVAAGLKEMLERTEHRGPDGAGVALGLALERAADINGLSVRGLGGIRGLGHSQLKVTGDVGPQPLKGCGKGLVVALNGEIWNFRELRQQLESRNHVFKTDSDSEVLVHQLEEALAENGDLVGAAETVLLTLEGEFAFAAYLSLVDEFVLARDVVGVRPLYYGESDEQMAFCSEKRPLWDLSMVPQRVLPGEVIRLAPNGPSNSWEFFGGSRVALPRPDPADEISEERTALEAYWGALVEAVRKRLEGRRRIGMAFSGGVDSVLIARLAQRIGVDVHCYVAGVAESNDVTLARNAADALGVPLVVSELELDEIESELPTILRAIESTDHFQVDMAIPIYFAVRQAAHDGHRVLLTGQGADELFAGHPWHQELAAEGDPARLRERLWRDINNLHRDTLEREDKLTIFHNVELRVPYLDPRVIETAMQIAPDLKFTDGIPKYIHRKLAEDAGVPRSAAWRRAESTPHGSASHEALKEVLERIGDRAGTPSGSPGAFPVEVTSGRRLPGQAAYAGDTLYQQVLDALGTREGVI